LRQQALASPIFDAPRFATHFEEALRGMWNLWCDRSHAETHYQRGIALYDQGQFEESASCFQQALDIDPSLAAAHCNLGNAFKALEHFDAAIASYQRAVQIQPLLFVAHNNLGVAFKEAFQLHAAFTCFERALQIAPHFAEAYVNLGSVLSDLGRPYASLNALKTALDIDPACETAHNNLLLVQNYLSDQPMDRMLADARRFGRLITKLARPYTQWSSSPDVDRGLRVGLVSGDLCSHSVGYFLDGVLSALKSHCASSLELFAYPSRLRDDETSHRLRAHFAKWYPAVGLSDAALAQCIHEDGIDILIDLSGHTAHNRLPVFAWRPAPVQVSWLGYCATTGVAEIDYYLADAITLPASQQAHFTETIWKLPGSYICFSAPEFEITGMPPPSLRSGQITFGSFNNLNKMGDETVRLWARVLQAIPESRLLLKASQLADQSVQLSTLDRYARHGIAADRLILEARIHGRCEHLAAYHRVDIALDPSPYNGVTTTIEALWMGVPVLTLAGESFVARQGAGLLTHAGLSEWIATAPDDFVTKAFTHAANLQGLTSLRTGLRERVLASPIFNAPRFAEHFAVAMRDMWRIWCESETGGQHARPR
jgi:protein O-GlcNAc transferase